MNLEAKLKHKISKAVKDFGMFNRTCRILAAVSGGKDSLSLARLLKTLNYRVEALFIDLGIEGYSEESWKAAEKLCTEEGIPIHVVDLKNRLGVSLPRIAENYSRNACAACGSVKRKIFNDFAREQGFDVLVTGHHLDDEAANLLANNLRWDWSYLKKCYPVLEARPGFVKRAKPLCFCREAEIQNYVEEKGIVACVALCPFVAEGSRKNYKAILQKMDEAFPGMTARYYLSFLKGKNFIKNFEKKNLSLKTCSECGDLTAHEMCRVCLILQREWQR